MNIDLLVDTGLFLSSVTASVYCLRLQARLRSLQDSRGSVQEAIKRLGETVSSSQLAAASLKVEIAGALKDLDERYGHLHAKRQEVDDVLDAMDGQLGLQVRRCHEARQLTERALTPLVRKAELEIQALTKALELRAGMDDLAALEKAPADRTQRDWDDILTRALDGTLQEAHDVENAAERSNPFLRAVGG